MLRDPKERSIESLKQIKNLLDKHNIEHWLDEGTLLGVVREGKLIEWDHDIDLGTWIKNIEKIITIFDEIRKIGLEVCFFEWNKHIKLLGIGYEIDINLYFLKNNKAVRYWHVHNKLGRVIDYLIWIFHIKNPESRRFNIPFFVTKTLVKITNMLPTWINKKIIGILAKVYENNGCKKVEVSVPSHFFTNLSSMKFYNETFKIPKETEEYLEYRYGKDWRIPKRDYVYYRDDGAVQ